MTYIVYWILVETVMGSCPNVNKPNEFGYVSSSNTVCAAMHWEHVRTEKRRSFNNRDSAFHFYTKALQKQNRGDKPVQIPSGTLGGALDINNEGSYKIENVRIDSLKR